MIGTILAAVDGSNHAERALAMAAEMAGKFGARLVVLHILMERADSAELAHFAEIEHLAEDTRQNLATVTSDAGGRTLTYAERRVPKQAVEAIGRLVVDQAQVTARQKGAPKVTGRIEEGDAAHCILDAAKQDGADLIVMGTRGLGHIRGLLMGSVSHKVAQLAPCPVLLVK
jgi:nucleotide-binding universal stress UspA family protein